MTSKRIFITGASGCIGHYITEALSLETDHELYLLVRNPDKLKFDDLKFGDKGRAGITILKGDLRQIEDFGDLLKTMDAAILAATAWGGQKETFDINVAKTIQLINLLDPTVCEQVIYFSTASVLDRNNQLLKEAGELGTEYIYSKYTCLKRLSQLASAPKITTLFPTLVLGGDETKPYSHLSSGLPDIVKWINLIRWFRADGSFHFIHAQDIAQVVRYLIDHHPSQALSVEAEWMSSGKLVLGCQPLSVNQAVEEVCRYLGIQIYFRLPLFIWLANIFIVLFRIQMDPWSRFSLNYRHFIYHNPVNPTTFGLPTYCPTLTDVLKVSGITRD
ncbi:MAG: NAD(P)-dependent oxidoreductase [Moorea sp. SIO2I5]|nr:NAD(P)-dependent oxidoreductase [Moorena sp. SIO2I5]